MAQLREMLAVTSPRRRALVGWIGRNWARFTYSRYVEPVWFEENHRDLIIPDLATSFDGVRVLQLTDFHLGSQVSTVHVRQVFDRCRRLEPDIIALTGDFVHAGFGSIATMGRLLERLRAPLGVFAVLGNHDYSVRNALGVRRFPTLAPAISRMLVDSGITVLHNEHRLLDRDGGQLAVAGVDDLWSREMNVPAALDGLPPTVPRIVLAHNPMTVEHLDGRRCDLMLSGHTHGGQVDLPVVGRALLSKRMKEYAAGWYDCEGGHLYVNKGVGFTVPIRFKVRPEIAIFRLKARADLNDL